MTASEPPLLQAAGLVKRYGGLLAIDHVDLAVPAGSVTGIIGPNGAGKSTLIGLIGGALAQTAGTIRLAGRDISRLPAFARARAGIGRTYQIPRPFLDMTVADNVAAAQYAIEPFIGGGAARQAREALLARTGLADAARTLARDLPLLRRKRLEVARALALKPRLLLLDEVGAGLVDTEISELIALIRSVADGHTAIVIVEHVIRVIRECCGRSIVLNFGKTLIEGPTADILANDEVAAVYLGTHGARHGAVAGAGADRSAAAGRLSLGALIAAPDADAPDAGSRDGPLLELQDLDAGYGQARVLRGLSLAVAAGQAVAILGANGAGKTTLARAMTGAIVPTAGAVRFAGRDIVRLPQHRVAALGIAHCMEGRRIIASLSVEENLLLAARDADRQALGERLAAVYALFPVLAERKHAGGTSMSGGQQQMLAIGRALMARPRLVIFDEISLGLAPVVMDRLYEALALLKQAGMTLIIIEQDVDRALALADYAYVLEQGRVGLSGPPHRVAADPRLRHLYVGTPE